MHCYEWSNGSAGTSITAGTTGVYWAKIVTSNFCVLYDTITVKVDTVPNAPKIYRDKDTLKTDDVSPKYQWLRDGNRTGENKPFLTLSANDTGIYSLRIMNNGGCTAISDTIHVLATKDTAKDNVNTIRFENIKINPNPFTNKIEITDQDGSISNIVIYTISGQKLYNGQAKNIDTSNWQDGIYQMTITLNDGQIITHKLIKHTE